MRKGVSKGLHKVVRKVVRKSGLYLALLEIHGQRTTPLRHGESERLFEKRTI